MKKIQLAILLGLSLLFLSQPLFAQNTVPTNKNLFNPALFEVDGDEILAFRKIPLEPNTTYTFSFRTNHFDLYKGFTVTGSDEFGTYFEVNIDDPGICFDNNDYLITCTFTTNENSTGIYIDFYDAELAHAFRNGNKWYEEMQLELGTVRTSYVEYVGEEVPDETPPVFQGQGYYFTSYQTQKSIETIINENITAYDEIDGDLTDNIQIISDQYTGNEGIIGTYEVLLEVSDFSHNKAQFLLIIIVKDEINPIIDGPDIIFVDVDLKPNITTIIADNFSFYDDYDGVITSYEILTDNYTNQEHVLGSKSVSIQIEDSSGNKTNKTFTINIKDNTPPVIHGETVLTIPLSLELSIQDLLMYYYATDNHDNNPTLSIKQHNLPNEMHLVGTYQMTLLSTDSSGNETTLNVTVHIIDDIDPVILGERYYEISYKDTLDINVIKNQLTISDNHDNLTHDDLVEIYNSYTQNKTQLGLYKVVYKLMDESGNFTTHTFFIKVIDDQAPIFEFIGNITLEFGTTISNHELFNILLTIPEIKTFNPTHIELINQIEYSKVGKQYINIELTNEQGETLIETIRLNIVEEVESPTYTIYYVMASLTIIISITTYFIIKRKL